MKFVDMDVWKRSIELTVEIKKSLETTRDYGFKDQIGRAALSVPSNIAEGMERTSIKESLNFLSYAKASCGEVYCQLVVGERLNYFSSDLALKYKNESQAISKMLGSLINKRKSFIKNS